MDASDFALGVELSQFDDCGELRPIFYGSRHLSKAERNYSATARETLAVVFGCEYFREYLQGRKFVIRSDHNPLVWLRGMKEPKRPYSGWIMRLEQFDYKIEYRAGKDHCNADFNSRINNSPISPSQISIGTQTLKEDIENMKPIRVVKDIAVDPTQRGTDQEVREKVDSSDHQSTTIYQQTRERDDPSDTTPTAVKCQIRERDDPSDRSPTTAKRQIGERDDPSDTSPITAKRQIRERDDPSDTSLTTTKRQIRERDDLFGTATLTDQEIRERDDPSDTPPADLIMNQQERDEDIGPVIKRLKDPESHYALTEKGERLWREKKKLILKNGLLVRQYRVKAMLDPVEQVVLPNCLKDMVMETLHDSPFAGHFGVRRTTVRVQIRYYWPGYLADIENWCKSCLICQQRKGPQNANVAPMTPLHTGDGPFERIALDILKLPLTENGNQYLLVVEDFFSKWIEAFPLKRTVAPCVAQCLLNGWVARFGCPYTVLSDQGSEFESKLFKSLTSILQVKKLRTTPYHPRTDGMVERSNRTIIDILSKYCERTENWDQKLPLVLFAIRTSEHSTTGFSPFNLLYGREAKIPWDIVYGPAPNAPMPREKWVAERKKHMTQVFQMVQEITRKKQMAQKKYFDGKLGKFQVFEIGETVMYCDPAARSKVGKLNKPWLGPFKVAEKISDALYKIDLKGKLTLVNTERLKKFYPREKTDGDERSLQEVDSSDEESLDETIGGDEPPGQVENVQPQGNAPIAGEGGANPIEGWGENGELRCNVDPGNIVQGGRRR